MLIIKSKPALIGVKTIQNSINIKIIPLYLPYAYLSANNVFFDIEYLVSSSLAGLTRCLYLPKVSFIEVTQYL